VTGDGRRRSFDVVGVGVAACAACCAVPLASVLGGIGVAGLLGWLVVGVGALAVAAAVAVTYVVARRVRA
jgi:hypothetical protein